MLTTNVFSISRFLYLLKNELLVHFRTSMITFGAIISVLSTLALLSNIGLGLKGIHVEFFKIILVLGGYLLTAVSFKVLHHKKSASFYLMLPAALFEKLLSKLILTSIGHVAGISLLYYLITYLVSWISIWLFGQALPTFNLFTDSNLTCVSFYLITQSIFLLGSIHFKSRQFIKTVFSIWLFGVVILISIGISAWYILDYSIRELDMHNFYQMLFKQYNTPVFKILKYSIWFGVAPFFWFVSYLKLKKHEV